MKQIFILFSFILSTQIVTAQFLDFQDYYMGTGYGVGYGSFKQASGILQRYNDANTQESAFKDFNFINGFSIYAGTTQGIFNFELGMNISQQTRRTEFNDGTDLYRRDVRLRMDSYSAGAGFYFPITRNFGWGTSAHLTYNRMKMATRQALDKSVSRKSFITPSIDNAYGLTIDTKFYIGPQDDFGTKLMIRPYYAMVFGDIEGKEIDENINGGGASNGHNNKQNMSHFGLRLILIYSYIR